MSRSSRTKKALFKKLAEQIGGRDAYSMDVKKKNGRWVADVTFNESRNGWYSPSEILTRRLSGTLDREFLSSPAKLLEHRIGENHNLSDPFLQRCFQAAALAKKYNSVHYSLARVYNKARYQQLNEKDCLEVFRIVGGLGGTGNQGLGDWAQQPHLESAGRAAGGAHFYEPTLSLHGCGPGSPMEASSGSLEQDYPGALPEDGAEPGRDSNGLAGCTEEDYDL